VILAEVCSLGVFFYLQALSSVVTCNESPTGRVMSRVILLSAWLSRFNGFTRVESQLSQSWLHSSRVNGYANCMLNKNATLQVETCLSALRITFYLFMPFQSQPIQLQYFWWIYSEQVVVGLTWVIYGRNQLDLSSLIESNHLGLLIQVKSLNYFFVFESSCSFKSLIMSRVPIQLFQLRLSLNKSEKVEYERERLAGNR
jgi:hypothetical protein